ncbi:hypothetical protein B0H34DRAFT_792703 [Crassisporium funariophilum]|nr:hypothetical protein B0H34DRAFT_792703 [Crassisporium funariophilum]
MFLPRTPDEGDTCPHGQVSCTPSYAIVPSDTTGSDADDTNFDPSMQKPGAHRYIGIGMVAALLLIVLVVWLIYGKWPRSLLRNGFWCCRRSPSEEEVPQSPDTDDDDVKRPEKESRRTRDSEKVVKQVAGGMVVFTEAPRALQGRERYPVDWELEHVHGVRFEVNSLPRVWAINADRLSSSTAQVSESASWAKRQPPQLVSRSSHGEKPKIDLHVEYY